MKNKNISNQDIHLYSKQEISKFSQYLDSIKI